MLFFLAIKNFRSYLWDKVILELFTIAYPHVALRYLLAALKWSVLLIGCWEVNIFIIWFFFFLSRSKFSCKWSLIIVIRIICYLKRKIGNNDRHIRLLWLIFKADQFQFFLCSLLHLAIIHEQCNKTD